MSTPRISILVPIYNVAPYLEQCLDSIVHQTFSDLEIICINDGSTDNSLDIVHRFAQRDPRIIIIDKKNTGYGDSMNLALRQAKGEYVGIVEPDDWVEPGAFERLYRASQEFDADVVKANYYKFRTAKSGGQSVEKILATSSENTPDLSNRPLRGPEHPLLFQFAPAIWSAIYRRQFLLDNDIRFLPTPGASYQDLSFSFKVWATAKSVVLLPDAFYHYRVDNSTSSVNSPDKVDCVIEEYAEIETFLCERGLFSQLGAAMNAAKFRNYHWNFQRLSPNLARDFFRSWRQDLLAAEKDDLLKRPYFSSKDWLALRAILKHPRLSYRLLRLRASLRRRLPRRH